MSALLDELATLLRERDKWERRCDELQLEVVKLRAERAATDNVTAQERQLEDERDALVGRFRSLVAAIDAALPIKYLPFRLVAELEEFALTAGICRPW